MTKKIFKITAIVGFAAMALSSCSKENPPLVYFPDMYFPVAYDPLMKADDAYTDRENQNPAFVKNGGATGLRPVDGTVAQNADGVVSPAANSGMTVDMYNAGYEASKLITTSPLQAGNQQKDIERGKVLFNQACAACHGTGGDGQGPIVASGAYSGVPNYKDRELTVASVQYVIKHGRNAMGSYAGQLKPGDQWRVAMYVMNEFKGGLASASTAVAGTTTSTPGAAAALTETPAPGAGSPAPTAQQGAGNASTNPKK